MPGPFDNMSQKDQWVFQHIMKRIRARREHVVNVVPDAMLPYVPTVKAAPEGPPPEIEVPNPYAVQVAPVAVAEEVKPKRHRKAKGVDDDAA